MSTYFMHFGRTNIRTVISKTNWELGNEDGIISLDEALKTNSFSISNGKDCLWLKVDDTGIILSFISFGSNAPDFLFDLIGYCVSEYDYSPGYLDSGDEEELQKWIKDNTFNKEVSYD